MREGQIRRARDQVVGQLHNGLFLPFVTDFRAAQHDEQIRSHPLEQGDDLGGLRHVPDVDAETDDARLFGQQRFGDVQRALGDDEFAEGGVGLQLAQVGVQVA